VLPSAHCHVVTENSRVAELASALAKGDFGLIGRSDARLSSEPSRSCWRSVAPRKLAIWSRLAFWSARRYRRYKIASQREGFRRLLR
jgi:hypothetical protein